MDFIAAIADRIIVLGDGRVAEEGTHATLQASGGLTLIAAGSKAGAAARSVGP